MAENDAFLRPSEILHFHPEISTKWTVEDMGILLRMRLVRGRKLNRGCCISVIDVLKLFKSTL